MRRDLKFLRRNSGKDQDAEEIENVPINPNDLSSIQALNPKPSVEQVGSLKRKCEWTPVKARSKMLDTATLPVSAPERQGTGHVGRKRLALSSAHECCDEGQSEMANYFSQSVLTRNGSSFNLTPRVEGTAWRANRGHSESCASTQNTPARSVSKPPNPGFAPFSSLRHPGSARAGSYAALSRRFSVSSGQLCNVNTVEVPHFDLKEDPSFWMDHNVQVIIRVRPLNSFEINTHGYNRCVKQENAQSITWIGQPETRFTFDHVACETVDQEMLFRMSGLPMVENCLSGYNSCMFAYGQTGSGKTYTMLGEMEDLEFKPSSHRGMTPRIFEFLFARISAEEESRRDEKLKYSCKCSFIEIYNEQITDLLDPTSTNLLLREDVKKGVYVENLSEFEVHSVSDVLRLLMQGSSNRKVAATDMNRESSRSHSVFTCVVESKWERDSTTNLRFARLNLVDLAGSERQKSSGAEGERLKEAANINRSLSTLGHVIMLLVDIAQGKTKHVPYRDSRLTFLLQDSLGGNSKTMIIANISPSVCCAAETLNTLKFAQRAKLIQNNAVVNEDSSGDVAALQHQIWLLREELSSLKRQNVSRRLAFDPSSTMKEQENTDTEIRSENDELKADKLTLKSMENVLAGALRREQIAEASIKELKAEIEQLNLLVYQREEDTKCTKMMLKFREDKIKRMESLLGDLKPIDAYLLEENSSLCEEIQLLRAKFDKNPEVTRFASENIRLQEQLRRFQDFYEEGERDILMNEISELRSQLIHLFDNNKHQQDSNMDQASIHNIDGNVSIHSELTGTLKELTECRSKLKSCSESNVKLSREIKDLHALLRNKETNMNDHHGIVNAAKNTEVPTVVDQAFGEEKCRSKHGMAPHVEEILNLELELDILKIMLKEERLSCAKMEEMIASLIRDAELTEERVLLVSQQCDSAKRDLKEAKSVIEALESQQLLSINEIEDLKNCNDHYLGLLHKQELEIYALKEQTVRSRYSRFRPSELKESPLQVQLKRMQASLDKAKNLNMWYQNDHDAQRSNEEEMDKIRRQVEAETADVIVSLQEELSMLQHRVQESDLKEREAENKRLILESNLKELQETLDTMSQDNELLHQNLLEKDMEIKSLKEDWETLRPEIEGALLEGNETLSNVCDQVHSFSCPLSDKSVWLSEQMGRMIRDISEKESIIQELNQCLEDANVRANDMEHMLLSLRGAAMVLTESHEQDCCEKEETILQLRSELSRKTYAIAEFEQRLKLAYDEVRKASTCATVAFVVVNRLSQINSSHLDALRVMDIQLRELQKMNQKDGSPFEKYAAFEEAQRKIEPRDAFCNNCISLRQQLHKQQRHISTLQRKIMENEKCALEKTIEILEDYETEVSMGRPSLNECAVGYPERNQDGIIFSDCFGGERELQQPSTATEYEIHEVNSSLAVQLGLAASNTVLSGRAMGGLVAHDSSGVIKIFGDSSKNDTTSILLVNEIGSPAGSLKETQAEIAYLSDVKKEIYFSEGKACEDIEVALETQALSLQAAFSAFEKQCESKILILNHKLHIVDECAQEAKSSWSRTKELHKSGLVDAKYTVDRQTAQFFSLAELEEAQVKMKEANMMINELMTANERMKLETENMKKVNVMLTAERDSLITEVQELQSSYAVKDQNYKSLEEQFEWSASNIISLVEDIVRIVSEAEGTYEGALTSIVCDFNSLKSQIQDAVKWMHLSLEEISSEIVAQDCALSVSYICYMGVLLDSIIELQSENNLLHVGICESDAVISDLRENNMKSEEELQIYQMLDGKLSADIKNNLVCLSNKENETRELSVKLNSFKEKLEILQNQEELMLERSNNMSFELAVLTEKLDQSNSTVMVSLLEQERLLKGNEDQVEIFMLELTAKDFQLLILVSELQQLAHRNADLEKEQIVCCSALDYLVRDVVTLRIVADLRKQLLSERETEVTCLQIGAEEAKDGEAKVLKRLQKVEEEYTTLKEYLNMKEKENASFKNKLQETESSNSNLLKDIQEKDLECKSLTGCIDMLKLQNCRLEVDISTLESRIAFLEKDLKTKKTELDDMSKALCKRGQDMETFGVQVNALQDENLILRDELLYLRQSFCKPLGTLTSRVAKCINSVGIADVQSCSMLEQLDKNLKLLLDKISQDACQNQDVLSGFLQELEFLEANVKGLVSENLSLQEQQSRKDEVLNGLLFDLHLLQENAVNREDQMDEIGKLTATLKSAEDELAIRSSELDKAVAYGKKLGVKLKEQIDMITTLEMDLEKANRSLKVLSDENMGLRSHVDVIMAARASVEQELTEKRSVVDGLEKELLEMGNTLGQMNDLVESLQCNLAEISGEKDQLQREVMVLEEKVGTAHALAQENETIAAECQEVAESRRIYAEEKEEEVKLLESSALELGSTITALENKVDILKKEAERQQTKREALESELHSLKSHMHTIETADDVKRHLDEKAKNLQEALEHLEIVEEDLMKKDREITQYKTNIAELTMHAEGQASRLCRAESFLLRVMEKLVEYRVSSGTSSSITFDEVQRLNKKLKGTEKDRPQLVETLLGLFSNFPQAAGGTILRSRSNDCAEEKALEQLGVSGDET